MKKKPRTTFKKIMFYVYLLQSISFNEIYIGSTNNLKRRLKEHNEGKVISSRRYKPWRLSYYEAYKTERLARLREKRLKQNGNALRELKKRAGILISGAGRDLSSVTCGGKSGAGFTLVELLIAIAIVGIITTIMVVNFWKEGQRGELRQSAEILASNLRKVQNMGMTGQSLIVSGVSSVPTGGFGIYFNKTDPTKYKLFGDKNGDGKYDSNLDPNIEELISGGDVSLLRSRRVNIEIVRLCVTGISGCINSQNPNESETDITFKPPKPTPYTYYYDVQSPGYQKETGETVEIVLKQSNPLNQSSPSQCYEVTVVGASGQISDEIMASCP